MSKPPFSLFLSFPPRLITENRAAVAILPLFPPFSTLLLCERMEKIRLVQDFFIIP